MTTQLIYLPTIERVQRFTAAMQEFDFEVDLTCGRYTVNGKSIMGILSLDLNQGITARAEPPAEAEERLLEVLGEFA